MRKISHDSAVHYKREQGFTIVELLIVVVVIAILAGITVVSYNGISKNAKNSAIQSTLSQAVQKIEAFKINSATGLYPASLSAADLTVVNTSDTTYVYDVSSNYKLFCLASSRAGRTYYISSASLNPKPGICTAAIGTPGTGDVTVDGPSVAGGTNYTVYDSVKPSTSQSVGADGGSSLKIGNRFYTTEPTGVKITGLRIYNPTSSDSTFLSLGVTAYIYLNDWVGTYITATTTLGQTPLATKAYVATRTAGSWTDIMFDTPVILAPVTSAAGTNDLASLVVQFAGGAHYIYTTPAPSDSVQSTVRPGMYLAEHNNIGRGIASVNGGVLATHYAIDIIYTPVTP